MFSFVDVSHAVEHGMITYRGLPAPVVSDFSSREEAERRYGPGVRFHIGRVDMVANTGTYIDAPFHRFDDGGDLSTLPLEAIAGVPGRVVRASQRGDRAVDAAALGDADFRGRAVLIHTGWDRYWGDDQYFDGHPFLTADAAERLADEGAALVGIDSLNIDSTDDPERPVHTRLLSAGIPVVEHLCRLGDLPDDGFEFFAVPVPFKGMGSFPVRAFARIPTQ